MELAIFNAKVAWSKNEIHLVYEQEMAIFQIFFWHYPHEWGAEPKLHIWITVAVRPLFANKKSGYKLNENMSIFACNNVL